MVSRAPLAAHRAGFVVLGQAGPPVQAEEETQRNLRPGSRDKGGSGQSQERTVYGSHPGDHSDRLWLHRAQERAVWSWPGASGAYSLRAFQGALFLAKRSLQGPGCGAAGRGAGQGQPSQPPQNDSKGGAELPLQRRWESPPGAETSRSLAPRAGQAGLMGSGRLPGAAIEKEP